MLSDTNTDIYFKETQLPVSFPHTTPTTTNTTTNNTTKSSTQSYQYLSNLYSTIMNILMTENIPIGLQSIKKDLLLDLSGLPTGKKHMKLLKSITMTNTATNTMNNNNSSNNILNNNTISSTPIATGRSSIHSSKTSTKSNNSNSYMNTLFNDSTHTNNNTNNTIKESTNVIMIPFRTFQTTSTATNVTSNTNNTSKTTNKKEPLHTSPAFGVCIIYELSPVIINNTSTDTTTTPHTTTTNIKTNTTTTTTTATSATTIRTNEDTECLTMMTIAFNTNDIQPVTLNAISNYWEQNNKLTSTNNSTNGDQSLSTDDQPIQLTPLYFKLPSCINITPNNKNNLNSNITTPTCSTTTTTTTTTNNNNNNSNINSKQLEYTTVSINYPAVHVLSPGDRLVEQITAVVGIWIVKTKLKRLARQICLFLIQQYNLNLSLSNNNDNNDVSITNTSIPTTTKIIIADTNAGVITSTVTTINDNIVDTLYESSTSTATSSNIKTNNTSGTDTAIVNIDNDEQILLLSYIKIIKLRKCLKDIINSIQLELQLDELVVDNNSTVYNNDANKTNTTTTNTDNSNNNTRINNLCLALINEDSSSFLYYDTLTHIKSILK